MANEADKEKLDFAKSLNSMLQDNISKLSLEKEIRKNLIVQLKEETDLTGPESEELGSTGFSTWKIIPWPFS